VIGLKLTKRERLRRPELCHVLPLRGRLQGPAPSIEDSRIRGMRPTDIAKVLKIGRASVYRVLGTHERV
jgi:hypothetical protein